MRLKTFYVSCPRRIYVIQSLIKENVNEYDSVVEFGGAEDDDDEEDPELLRDSIYHLNLGQYLRDFLLNFSTHHCFRIYIQHLNVPELKVLNTININALM